MIGSWLSDAGPELGALAAGTVVLGFLATVVVLAVKAIVKPDLDKIHDRIDTHMGDEERQIDRIATALDTIARAIGITVRLPSVSGGSDEGDTP